MKLWDLSTQHCVQTVVAHRSEIWTLDVNPEQKLVFTGSGEGEMKAWRLDHEAMASGLQESETGEVSISPIGMVSFILISTRIGHQNDTSCHHSATIFET